MLSYHTINHAYNRLYFVTTFTASVPAPDIRLIGGSGPHEGRVEIQYNGIWGTVDGLTLWTLKKPFPEKNSASVICRQLGYGDAGSYETSTDVFGPGTGVKWDLVRYCAGFYDFPCVYDACSGCFGTDTFNTHSNDIGVVCNGKYSVIYFNYFLLS